MAVARRDRILRAWEPIGKWAPSGFDSCCFRCAGHRAVPHWP